MVSAAASTVSDRKAWTPSGNKLQFKIIHVGRTLDKQFEPIFSHCLSKFSWVLAVSLFYRWRDVLAKLTRYLSKVPRVFSVLSSTTSTASRCTAMTSCWMPISNRQSLYFVMFALICQTFLRFPNDIELK